MTIISTAASNSPIVIAHRGASGYVPEHTLAAYYIAIQQGADYIEPDLVSTQDGILIARHENEIGGTTDVADHPEFARRRIQKTIDGSAIEGWFAEDFTLAELKTLRARERIPTIRPDNVRFDGQFPIPTLEEILQLVRGVEQNSPRRIGIYAETKHPSYCRSIGLSLEEPLLKTLSKWGYSGRTAPIFLQSFEVQNLQDLRKTTDLPIIQLIEASGAPYDYVARGARHTYADLLKPAGLKAIAAYADGIGVHKDLLIPRDNNGKLAAPTSLVQAAHAAGLKVHAWTFRAENHFLPADCKQGSDNAARGDLTGEIVRFLQTGMDGLFTDQTDCGVRARQLHERMHRPQ
jgi:glycerophosphoryl diester phosphodiesterase